MLHSVYWYINFIFSLLIKQRKLKKVDKLLEEGKEEEYESTVYSLVTNWAKDRIKASGAKINMIGLENVPDVKGILFVSNHQSNFDILSLLAYLNVPKGFVAKTELGKVPMLSGWMKRIHCLFMDRGDIKQSAQTIIQGIKQLKQGINMVIFPEGTRGKNGVPGEFKAGSFKLATKAKAPIVPITIDGTYKIMEGNNNIIKPAEVNIYIHPAIYTSELTKEEINELPQRVENIIISRLS